MSLYSRPQSSGDRNDMLAQQVSTLQCTPLWDQQDDPFAKRGVDTLFVDHSFVTFQGLEGTLYNDYYRKKAGDELTCTAKDLYKTLCQEYDGIAKASLWALCVSEATRQMSESQMEGDLPVRFQLGPLSLITSATEPFTLVTTVHGDNKPEIHIDPKIARSPFVSNGGQEVDADDILVDVRQKCQGVFCTNELWNRHFTVADEATRQTLWMNHVLGELIVTIENNGLATSYKATVRKAAARPPRCDPDPTDYGFRRFTEPA